MTIDPHDPHVQATMLSGGTVQLEAWVTDQVKNNTQLSGLQKLALGHIPLDLYGQIVQVVIDGAVAALDKQANPPQENSTT